MLENPNYRKMLRLVFSGKSFSQVNLSDAMDISTAAVCTMVRDLTRKGLLRKTTQKASKEGQTGRKPVILALDDRHFAILSVWVNAGIIEVHALSLTRRVLHRSTASYEDCETMEDLIERLTTVINAMRNTIAVGKTNHEVLGVGVAIGGDFDLKLDPLTGSLHGEDKSYHVEEHLTRSTGLPVTVGDLWVATCVAERWFGSAVEHTNFVYFQLLPFMRAVVFLHDRLFLGSTSFAGQIGAGLNAVEGDPSLYCDRIDHAIGGLVPLRERLAKRRTKPGVLLSEHVRDERKVLEVFRNMRVEGDGTLSPEFQRLAEELGRILVNISAFYDPSLIVLGAFDDKRDEALIRAAREEMRKWLIYRTPEDYRIAPPHIQKNRTAIGPMSLFLERLLGPEGDGTLVSGRAGKAAAVS